MFSDNNTGFFVPQNVNNNAMDMQGKRNDDGQGQARRKNKVFTPVTMKMIAEAQPRPDDVCDIDGEPINDIIIVGRVT